MNQLYKLSIFITIIAVFTLNFTANSQSVLSTGQWYQLGIEKDGIYKLSYQDFIDMGFDVDGINPNHIQIYGNVNGQLPEANNIATPNSLLENAIFVSGAEDGSFDANDYVAFYAKGADKWRYEILLQRFRYESHNYDENNYYYVTIGEEEGSRIGSQTSTSQTPLKVITNFLDYQAYEVDMVNFVKSGRKWYGEPFDTNPNQRIDFDFPNFINDKKVMVGLYAAGRSEVNSEIHYYIDGCETESLTIPKKLGDYVYAKEAKVRTGFYTDENHINLNLNYTNQSPPIMLGLTI